MISGGSPADVPAPPHPPVDPQLSVDQTRPDVEFRLAASEVSASCRPLTGFFFFFLAVFRTAERRLGGILRRAGSRGDTAAP